MSVLVKEEKKITKYQPLVWQLKQLYHQPLQVIPIVFGVTGVVSKNQRMYLRRSQHIMVIDFLQLCRWQLYWDNFYSSGSGHMT